MSWSRERRGELSLLITALIEGLYPVLAVMAASQFPPATFMTLSVATATIGLFGYAIYSHQLPLGVPLRVWGYALLVASFILSGFVLILIGAKTTTGISTALLLQLEMLWAFFLAIFLLKEVPDMRQLLGAFLVFIGTFFILFSGTLHINPGHFWIIAATVLFPIGNLFAKRGLAVVSPVTFLLMRYVIGTVLLALCSLFIEEPFTVLSTMEWGHIWLIVLYGTLVLIVSKVCWYSGLRELPLGKATYIGSSGPAFSLLFAYLLLHETSSMHQLAGFVLTVGGVYLLIKRSKARATSAGYLV